MSSPPVPPPASFLPRAERNSSVQRPCLARIDVTPFFVTFSNNESNRSRNSKNVELSTFSASSAVSLAASIHFPMSGDEAAEYADGAGFPLLFSFILTLVSAMCRCVRCCRYFSFSLSPRPAEGHATRSPDRNAASASPESCNTTSWFCCCPS